MAVNYGKLSTENVLQTNRLYDATETVFLKYPDQAPFTATMVAMDNKVTSDPEFWWYNRGDRAAFDAINNGAGYNAAATTLVVDNADKFVPGDQLVHIKASDGSYNETMRVSAVTVGTNTIEVVRGTGTTAAGSLTNDDTLLRIGTAYEEGSALPAPVSEQLTRYRNYTQIFRDSAIHTRTFLHTKMRAGNQDKEIQKRRKETMDTHRRSLESAMIWGEFGVEGASSAQPNRKTGGLYYWLGIANAAGFDNSTAAAASTLTESAFEQFLEAKAFAYGGDEKIMFCSPRVISVLNDFPRAKIQLENRVTSYGLNVTTWHSPHGTLNIVRHRQFSKGVFQYAGLVVDPNHVCLKYIGDSMTTFKTNVGTESDDTNEDSILSEVGLQVAVPESLAFLSDVQNSG